MGAAPEGENPLQLPKKLQVVVEVPKNVRPGVTKLAVDVDEESELHILVPVEAAVGDRLRISKEEGGPWTCVILKNQPLYDMTNRQLSSPGGDTGKLQLLVPATIKPGETKLQVSISDSEQVQLSVPENASPGDLVELVRSAETWTAKFTRDRYSVASDPKNNLAVMADLAKTSSQAGLDAEAAAENLIAVAKEAGCFVSPKIKRGCVPPLNIPGLVAVEAIEEGEELIRVPSKFHITPPAVERAAPVLAEAAKASSLQEQRRLEALHAFFVARLLADSQERAVSSEKASNSNAFNRWTATEDQKKVWEAYADTLLTEDFSYHPFRLAACSPEEMRGHLSPSQEAEYYIDMASDLMSLHDTMLRSSEVAGMPERLEAEMFLRARMSAQTRVFQTCVDTTLVPVADLLNHSPTLTPGVLWSWDAKAEAMIVTAVRAHNAGEELFTTYGARSNMLLYRTYGFTLHPINEPSFTYIIRPHLVRPIMKIFLDDEDARPLILLETSHIDDSLCQNSRAQMAPSIAAPIGAAWLEQNGRGHVNGEQREVLAKALTSELETKGFPKDTIEKEVGEFLDRGRVSATNLDRLARRVQCSSVKLKPPDVLSARVPPDTEKVMDLPVPNSARERQLRGKATPDIHELARWSVVAAIEKQRMEDEKQEQQLVDRERKSRYREFLKGQVEERLKEKEKENEEKVVVRALADKDREQVRLEELATTQTRQEKMIRLKDDILSQVSAAQSRKQEEKWSDVKQAQKENQRAIRLMEEEKVEIAKRKEIRRVMDQTQAQAWAEQRQRGLDQRRWEAQLRAIEKQRREEAAEIMRRENQEILEQAKTDRSHFFARLHLRKDVARTDRLNKRNERIQQELQELAPIRSAADRQEEEERRKDEIHRRKRRENVEFLQKQMEEKEERLRRDQEFEQRKLQEHQDLVMKQAEKDLRKQEDLQKRRSRYKAELLDQLAEKKANRASGYKIKKDFMSDMEISLNKVMLEELSVFVDSPKSHIGKAAKETF